MAPYVGVRFRCAGPLFPYATPEGVEVNPGDFVVVDTPRGKQVGWVTKEWQEPPENWKEGTIVLRVATPRDLLLWQLAQQKGLEALVNARAHTQRLGLQGLSFIYVEVSLDHQVYTFEYHAEETPDGKAWRRLQDTLQRTYPKRLLQFHRLGARDAAKWEGGPGTCGAPRCCSLFLTDFQSIQIRMAKDQHLSLASADITGMCGRLRCCLAFEHAVYRELLDALPKLKSRVRTPKGEGKVVDLFPLQGKVVVELPDRTRITYSKEEIEFTPRCQLCPKPANGNGKANGNA